MECLYINLDAEAERRAFLSANFEQFKKQNWSLSRVNAVSLDEADETAGLLSLKERACYLSHRKALAAAQEVDGPVLILEDDAAFGPHSCEAVDRVLAGAPQLDWDLFYTDVGLGSTHQMIDLALLRRKLMPADEMRILNLAEIAYFGATAYIVNAKSKDKVAALVCESPVINVPFDLLLRNAIHAGKLKGFTIFPFPTTTSVYSTQSQVQPDGTAATDYFLDAFRKVIWYDRDIESCLAPLESYAQKSADPEMRAYGAIVGAMLGENFKKK